jgi:hypothetical protein
MSTCQKPQLAGISTMKNPLRSINSLSIASLHTAQAHSAANAYRPATCHFDLCSSAASRRTSSAAESNNQADRLGLRRNGKPDLGKAATADHERTWFRSLALRRFCRTASRPLLFILRFTNLSNVFSKNQCLTHPSGESVRK